MAEKSNIGFDDKDYKKRVEKYQKDSYDKSLEGKLMNQFNIGILRDVAMFLLLDEHPCRNQESLYVIERFLNYFNPDRMVVSTETDKTRYDLLLWCKSALKEINDGVIISGKCFLQNIDDKYGDEFIDVVNNVKNSLPMDEYLNNTLDEEVMLKYLSENDCKSMIHYIENRLSDLEIDTKNEVLNRLYKDYKQGRISRLDYTQKVDETIREFDMRLSVLNAGATKSALDSGFTAGLPEDECRNENRRNLKIASTGCNKFRFGHRWLNLVTSGGIESKQLMVYGAPSGNGKTSMLISSAIDMAMYNPDVKYEEGLKPCILYISAEAGLNDIKERYIKMVTGKDVSWDDEIRGEKCRLSEEEIEELLVEASEELHKKTPTRIRFIQVPNGAYTKREIIRDIETLRKNEKLQVVAVVADYLKGFRPLVNSSENRIIVENTITDLRAVAIECDVAVLTASQIKGEVSEEITRNRSKFETSVIPECNEYVFSETKGVLECCDYGILFAQTSNKYEKLESTGASIYTHLEAMVLKSRSGAHNRARAFIPYVEGSQIAFQKDVDLQDRKGNPIWLTTGELEYIGDPEKRLGLDVSKSKTKSKLFNKADKVTVSAEYNMVKQEDVMDTLPEFNNEELNNLVMA